jgi:chemotaxis protein CheX
VSHAEQIAEATREIFSSMIMLDVTSKEAIKRTDPTFNNSISGMVGLAGSVKGNLSIHMPEQVAASVTTAFLGMDVESIDEDVCDAIGELANMLAGAVKTALDPGGSEIKLSMPSTVYGEEYSLDCQKCGINVLVPFDLDGAEFSVELQLLDT